MKKFRAAVIGCGNIFPMHAVSVVRCENAELVAVCDVKKDRADAKAAEFGVKAYYDYIEMLEKEDIDVVHICLPHYLHPIVSMECSRRGKHVFTEKPMSINIEDARAMIDVAKENNVICHCVFQNRYNAGALLAKKLLDDGTFHVAEGSLAIPGKDVADGLARLFHDQRVGVGGRAGQKGFKLSRDRTFAAARHTHEDDIFLLGNKACEDLVDEASGIALACEMLGGKNRLCDQHIETALGRDASLSRFQNEACAQGIVYHVGTALKPCEKIKIKGCTVGGGGVGVHMGEHAAGGGVEDDLGVGMVTHCLGVGDGALLT